MSEARSVEDLRELGESVSALSKKLKKTPGLSEGHVERLATAVERILRDYDGASFRQYRNLVRDLDVIAADVARLGKDKALHPKLSRILDAALLKIRKRDLYGGRMFIGRLAKLRASARERDRLLEEYREGYKEIEREIARLKSERDRLRTVRKPPVSEADVDRIKALLDSANRALAHAVMRELHDVPCHRALPALLEASRDRRLLLPKVAEDEAAPLFALLSDVGPMRETFGVRGVHGLLEALSYSDAKLAHLVGDGRPLRTALSANLAWLKAITAPGNLLPQFSLDLAIDDLRGRVEALTGFANKLHNASEAAEQIAEVSRAIDSGSIAKAQESDRLFRAFGDAARGAWGGTLENAVRGVERDLDRRTRDLASLSAPERLG